MNDLRNRGVRDILIACCDGLAGFEDAITAAFPATVVQRCIVHLVRNALRPSPAGTRPRSRPDCARSAPRRPPRPPSTPWRLRRLALGTKYPKPPGLRDAWDAFIPFLAFSPPSASCSTPPTRSSR